MCRWSIYRSSPTFALGINTRYRRVYGTLICNGIQTMYSVTSVLDIAIDVFVSTMLAPVWHIQGHKLHHTSWATPLCLGSVQILKLAAKEHNNGLRNDVGDDDTGATATINVMIAFNDDSVLPPPMTGTHLLQLSQKNTADDGPINHNNCLDNDNANDDAENDMAKAPFPSPPIFFWFLQ